MPEEYRPLLDVPCLITIRATPGTWSISDSPSVDLFVVERVLDEEGNPQHDVIIRAEGVVRVGPADPILPTGLGAVIRATVPDGRRLLIVRVDRSTVPWKHAEGSDFFVSTDLCDVEVLSHGYVSPDPMADYVPCDECESSGRNCLAHRGGAR